MVNNYIIYGISFHLVVSRPLFVKDDTLAVYIYICSQYLVSPSGVTSTNCQDDTTRAIYNYAVYGIECCPVVARPLYVKMTLLVIISDLLKFMTISWYEI